LFGGIIMSNEWKIAQGLKKKNENNRLNFEDAMVEKLNREQSLKDFKEDREWQENWGDFSISERTFDKSYEEVNVYEFQTFIQRCREKGLPLEGKKGDVAFTIISDNPLQVSFSVKDKDSNIVVNDNEVEYSQVEVRKEEFLEQ